MIDDEPSPDSPADSWQRDELIDEVREAFHKALPEIWRQASEAVTRAVIDYCKETSDFDLHELFREADRQAKVSRWHNGLPPDYRTALYHAFIVAFNEAIDRRDAGRGTLAGIAAATLDTRLVNWSEVIKQLSSQRDV